LGKQLSIKSDSKGAFVSTSFPIQTSSILTVFQKMGPQYADQLFLLDEPNWKL